MASRIAISACIALLFLLGHRSPVEAIYDPVSVPNNRLGVHILSPDEIEMAAKLVNGDHGSWGYVTVPIQATDRDYDRWNKFMEQARSLRVIPIIRVATYANGSHWLRPDDTELLDFANFLNDLPWPVKNRYVVVFNEVNRADEYGGAVAPEQYAEILDSAIEVFKSRSEDFFMLPAGLDNAAPQKPDEFIRWDIYLARMQRHRPGIFERIDGWTSHAYPNPAFSVKPSISGSNKIDSYRYDLKLLQSFGVRRLPVFITETGWSNRQVLDSTIANHIDYAWERVWVDDNIVSINPFLLFAGTEPFRQFSLLRADMGVGEIYQAWKSKATVGSPIAGERTEKDYGERINNEKVETDPDQAISFESFWSFVKKLFNYLMGVKIDSGWSKLVVGSSSYKVEVLTKENEWEVGLSKYEKIEDDQGMLFVFPKKGNYGFWMKGMKFDIDLAWIRDKKIVGVVTMRMAEPYKTVYPPEEIDMVLEVKSGSDLEVGQTITLE